MLVNPAVDGQFTTKATLLTSLPRCGLVRKDATPVRAGESDVTERRDRAVWWFGPCAARYAVCRLCIQGGCIALIRP
jgi:hypothetical protein